MTAETTILEIAHGALGPAYLDTIKVMYQQAVEDGVFETVESEYEAGIDDGRSQMLDYVKKCI